MNKMREYERGREDGLTLALRIARQGGLEAEESQKEETQEVQHAQK